MQSDILPLLHTGTQWSGRAQQPDHLGVRVHHAAGLLPADLVLGIPTCCHISGWMSLFQSKYGAVPSVTMFHIFGCIAYVHVSEQLRDSTFAEKAYKDFFVGLKWPLLDCFLVFIPALDKVVESAHVLFDEVTKVVKSSDELLIVGPQRRALISKTIRVSSPRFRYTRRFNQATGVRVHEALC